MSERSTLRRVLRNVVRAALLCSLAPAVAHANPEIAGFAALRAARIDPVSIPAIEPGRRVVSIAAADIDGDGDLDVVANDGSLDLIVWENDGTGHLTRKAAGRTRSLGPLPTAPGVSDSAHVPLVVTVSDSPVTSAPDTRFFTPARSRPLLTAVGVHVPAGSLTSSRSPRAPPTVLSSVL